MRHPRETGQRSRWGGKDTMKASQSAVPSPNKHERERRGLTVAPLFRRPSPRPGRAGRRNGQPPPASEAEAALRPEGEGRLWRGRPRPPPLSGRDLPGVQACRGKAAKLAGTAWRAAPERAPPPENDSSDSFPRSLFPRARGTEPIEPPPPSVAGGTLPAPARFDLPQRLATALLTQAWRSTRAQAPAPSLAPLGRTIECQFRFVVNPGYAWMTS